MTFAEISSFLKHDQTSGVTLEQMIVAASREQSEETCRFLQNGDWEKNPFMKGRSPIALVRHKRNWGMESQTMKLSEPARNIPVSTSEKENAPAFKSPPCSSSKKKRTFEHIVKGTRSPAATTPHCAVHSGSRRFKTARLTTPQRAIHSASPRPGTGSLKMATSPRPSGSSHFRGQALDLSSPGHDEGRFESSRNSFGPNSLEGGGMSSPVVAVVIVSKAIHPITEGDDEE